MPDDSLGLVELLEVLFLLLRQDLPLRLNRLVDPLDTAEPDDRARHPLVDPRQRDMAHFPPALFRNFLHARNDLLVDRGRAGCRGVGFLLAGGAGRVAEFSRRAGEVASAKGSPLLGQDQLIQTQHDFGGVEQIDYGKEIWQHEPESSLHQSRYKTGSSPSPPPYIADCSDSAC